MPVDIMIGTHAEEDATKEMEYVAALQYRLQSAYEDVRKNFRIT